MSFLLSPFSTFLSFTPTLFIPLYPFTVSVLLLLLLFFVFVCFCFCFVCCCFLGDGFIFGWGRGCLPLYLFHFQSYSTTKTTQLTISLYECSLIEINGSNMTMIRIKRKMKDSTRFLWIEIRLHCRDLKQNKTL